MHINKQYIESLEFLIKEAPWRVNDEDLRVLLEFTKTLIWEYEELNKQYSQLLSNSISHTNMLKDQLITSMLNKGDINNADSKIK